MAVKRKEGKRRVSIRGRTTKNKLQTFQQEVVMKVTVARVIEDGSGELMMKTWAVLMLQKPEQWEGDDDALLTE